MTFNTDRMMREATLPGMVRQQETEYGYECYVREQYSEICRVDRQNLNRALEIGKTLNEWWEKFPHGSKMEKLKKARIPHQRAYEYMAIAKLPLAAISPCQSVYEAQMVLKSLSPPEVTEEEEAKNEDVPQTSKSKGRPPRKSRSKMSEEERNEKPPEREPGIDPEEWESCVWKDDAEKLLRKAEKLIRGIGKVHEAEIKPALDLLGSITNWLKAGVEKPFKPIPAPGARKCKCGELLWQVMNLKGVSFRVCRTPRQGCGFALQGGLARYVPHPNGEPMYHLHVCPLQGSP